MAASAYTTVVAPAAMAQIEAALRWWSHNRPAASGLLARELDSALGTIAHVPRVGRRTRSARFHGRNPSPGALELEVLERTPARVRIRQRNHPRLNNGGGPPNDPFPELAMVLATTVWTTYPTGKIAIDFEAVQDPSFVYVDSGGSAAVPPNGASQSTR